MENKKIIKIEIEEPQYFLNEEVTYAQADAWFGHVTRDLRLDIIYPEGEKKYPCIIWICGGGWWQVSKSAHLPYLTDLARQGFVVASVDYRLGHEAPFPGALIDIKSAVRYLRAHANRYSINPDKFGVMGESAGGYLAAMIALTRNKEYENGEYKDYSSAVQAACPWYAPSDLSGLRENLNQSFPFFNGDVNDEKYRNSINPVSYIMPQSPPFLILHGTEDTVVPFKHGEILHDALIAKNIDARLIGLEGERHAGPQFFQRPLWKIIVDFFREKLG